MFLPHYLLDPDVAFRYVEDALHSTTRRSEALRLEQTSSQEP